MKTFFFISAENRNRKGDWTMNDFVFFFFFSLFVFNNNNNKNEREPNQFSVSLSIYFLFLFLQNVRNERNVQGVFWVVRSFVGG